MKVLISGGGTGGHIFPALAIAQHFMQQGLAQDEILFVGTKHGIESRVVPEAGFTLETIRSEGLVGKGFVKTLRASLTLMVSLLDAYKVIRRFKPNLVVGVGGYSSGPVVLTASLLGIATMIHEQNSVPGLTNRILGRIVDAIALSYPDSQKFFPNHKSFLTGNPVRETIMHGNRTRGYAEFGLKEGCFTIFVFGGSQGAQRINQAVVEALKLLKDKCDNIQFLHQSGYKCLEEVKKGYEGRGVSFAVLPFIKNMADAYEIADLVISRAGAITLAEITLVGKPAILIPYPFAAGNHQEHNAMELTKNGAAVVIADRELNAERLASWIRHFLEHTEELKVMAEKCSQLARPDAGSRIVETGLNLINRGANSNEGI